MRMLIRRPRPATTPPVPEKNYNYCRPPSYGGVGVRIHSTTTTTSGNSGATPAASSTVVRSSWVSDPADRGREKVRIRGNIPEGGHGVAVGQCAETERSFTAEDVDRFGRLVGDGNILHRAWDFQNLPLAMEGHPLVTVPEATDGEDEEPSKTVILVHGMLVSSLFSCIFGNLIPGAVYLRQSLDFRKPVYVNTVVIGRVVITKIRRYRRKGLILTCDTTVVSKDDDGGGEEKLRGEADVWLPSAVEE